MMTPEYIIQILKIALTMIHTAAVGGDAIIMQTLTSIHTSDAVIVAEV